MFRYKTHKLQLIELIPFFLSNSMLPKIQSIFHIQLIIKQITTKQSPKLIRKIKQIKYR